MILKRYVIRDVCCEDDFVLATQELKDADQVVMKLGYPHGKDAEECLIIYALINERKKSWERYC